ncbi:SDR family NAD(P)-dependent oxidoreductase [Alteromonas portus]|uniref:SDR family NAD(P)-dependent oxidoreductase n=1 Tax=Alteromonas portus TaxID=2565549 RepID=UPI003BF8FE34
MSTVIVFGAAGELGQAVSNTFFNAGFNVSLVGRNSKKLIDVKNQLVPDNSAQVDFYETDICYPEEVEQLFKQAQATFGKIEYVVNCAGKAVKGSILEVPFEEARQVIDTNTLGSLNIIKSAAKYLNSGGHIINVASSVTHNPMPMHSIYGMSKCAQIYLSEVAALELSERNIQVNSISPGIIESNPLIAWLETEQGKAFASKIPKHSIRSAKAISELILSIIQIREPSFTGNVISPDGGFRYFSNQAK